MCKEMHFCPILKEVYEGNAFGGLLCELDTTIQKPPRSPLIKKILKRPPLGISDESLEHANEHFLIQTLHSINTNKTDLSHQTQKDEISGKI